MGARAERVPVDYGPEEAALRTYAHPHLLAVAAAGTERLPDAVPIVCKPGDVAITNRQVAHGSFANTSTDWRVTFNFGFHRRRSALGVEGGGLHNAPAVYDAARIHERSRVLGYAIDARRQRFPHEMPFACQPHAGEVFRWDAQVRARLKDYNLLDLSI
jgi:ectoine hydroxylase-related dioxygenase (phytanoyl-CoA dioxygenase family)